MSPEVYESAKAIITAQANSLGLTVQWPNLDYAPPMPPGIWVSIDTAAESAETIELPNDQWLERGSIWIHTMLPIGIGIEQGLTYRKAFANAFRAAEPTTAGLHYAEHAYDPLSADDGLWRRLSLAVAYRYYDLMIPPVQASASFAGGGGMEPV
jgi:hypothetical protein